jgi:hypothetical protein
VIEHRGSLLLALAGLAIGAGMVYFIVRPDSHPAGDPASETAKNQSKTNGEKTSPVSMQEGAEKPVPAPGPPAKVDTTEIIVLDVAQSAHQLHSEEIDPYDDLQILQILIAAYRRIDGANPSGGLNSEIVAVLTGQNERKVAVIPPDHPALNAAGELVDRWGTPYWFHPVSREVMEVISAGPDGELFTDDDVQMGSDTE